MSKNGEPDSRPDRQRVPLPAGYRQAVVSAITVLLGFSLLFLRYWNFEAPGAWSIAAVIASALLAIAIVLQMVALWRSLQIEDDDVLEYAKTLRWLLGAIVLLLASLLLSAIVYNHFLGL